MNDVRNLLDRALADGHGPAPDESSDPAADLRRGRLLLRRRRAGYAASAGLSAALAGVVLVPLVAGTPTTPRGPTVASSAPSRSSASSSAATTTPTPTLRGVGLVAYRGAQPPGYRVAQVPAGWVVQGGDAFALTIARADDPDTQPASFAGKLVVMLQSADATPFDPDHLAPGEQLVQVGGRPAVFRVEPASSGAPATQTLVYRLPDGREVVVQAPVSLGWDAARLVRFAEGVQVLTNAEPGGG